MIRYNNIGSNIPPIAAKIGKVAFLSEFSSPINISLFISRPIRKKKIAINPSFIHRIRGFY